MLKLTNNLCFFWYKNDQNPFRNDFTIIFGKIKTSIDFDKLTQILEIFSKKKEAPPPPLWKCLDPPLRVN